MTFERKKINMETLSEYLVEVRKNLNLSEQEVVQKIGIKPQFFNALEKGSFNLLPADVYVMGFLRQLANLYSIEPEVLIEQYKKERNIQQQVKKQSQLGQSWTKKYFGRLVITPKLVSFAVGMTFVLLSVAYIIWQVLSINKTPFLEIYQPRDRQVIQSSFVEVQGKTDPGMSVTVNDQNIFVDTSGLFKTQLGINAGPTQITVTSKNKFDKSVIKSLSIIGDSTATPASIPSSFLLSLKFSDDVNLEYILDNQPSVSEQFHKGDAKILTAQDKMVISTSNAGATHATLNNQNLGVLGRPGEGLNNIQFFAPSSTSTP